jgi:hypothetical protein
VIILLVGFAQVSGESSPSTPDDPARHQQANRCPGCVADALRCVT